jgi:hypothetical protein
MGDEDKTGPKRVGLRFLAGAPKLYGTFILTIPASTSPRLPFDHFVRPESKLRNLSVLKSPFLELTRREKTYRSNTVCVENLAQSTAEAQDQDHEHEHEHEQGAYL